MELVKFLNLNTLLFGVTAAGFLCKVVSPTAEEVLRSTVHYSPMGWPSVEIISEKASPKADAVTSIILIAIVFVLQLGAFIAKDDTPFPATKKTGFVLATILWIIVSVVVYLIGLGVKAGFEQEIKMQAAKNRLEYYFKESSSPLFKDVEAMALQYFDLKKKPEEENPHFVKRFANRVEYRIPENADFSKFR